MVSYELNKTRKKRRTNRKFKRIGMKFSFHLRPRPNFVDVKEIYIYDSKLKQNVLDAQFNHVFKRLFQMVMYLDENATDGEFELAMNEISKARQILKDKYLHELGNKAYRHYLKKITLLEEEIRQKIVLQQEVKARIYDEELAERKGKSR